MYSFPYQIEQSSIYLQPICDVFLIGKNQRVLVKSLVDSGAVYSVFSQKAAEDAEIVLPRVKNFRLQYGGSEDWGWKMRVWLSLRETKWSADIVFVERLSFRYALLGRRSVFAQFNEVAFLEKIGTPRVEFR